MELDLSYESALRAVGAYLDRQPAQLMSVVELPDSFALRYLPNGTTTPVSAVLRNEDLLSRSGRVRRQRLHVQVGRERGTERAAPYQDFLRAVGYQLDRAEASEILVDQLESGYFVTYQFRDLRHGYVWRKRMVVIGPVDEAALVESAHARRDPGHSLFRVIGFSASR